MRIIHTIPAISEEASGGNYVALRLCESLIAQGQDLTIAALDWSPMPSPPAFLKTFALGTGPHRLGRSPDMKRWLREQAKNGKTALFHNHSLWMMPNVYPGQVARRYNIPLVLSPHGTLSEWAMQSGSPLKRVLWPFLQRPALSAVTCFHATAQSEYEDIRCMGFRQPVAIIPNGVDIPDLLPKNQGDFRTLLFLGRIHPIKGLDMLLPVWAAVQDRFPEWKLRIVGPDNGGYLSQMRRLAAELGLERVEFAGPLFGAEKLRAYQEADLFVLPTYSENFGIAVAEALAAGTPAIVTKGAPWEGLESHGCGWWIDIGVEALVACLEDALSRSTDELNEMGLRGRTWMEAEYSWNEIGRKMLATYNWLLTGKVLTVRPKWVFLD